MCCSVLQCLRTAVVLKRHKRKRWRPVRVALCTAVCCSVLHCVAMCCSVLQCVSVFQCVEVCCSVMQRLGIERVIERHVLQCVAVCCSMLQGVAVCCSVLQCFAVCCSMLSHVRGFKNRSRLRPHLPKCVLQCVAVAICFSVLRLQFVAVCSHLMGG